MEMLNGNIVLLILFAIAAIYFAKTGVAWASNAVAGVGTKLQRGNEDSSSGAAESFTDIAEVNSISGPTMSRGTIDVTSLDSTGGYREFITGFRDPGQVTLNMNFSLDTYDDFLSEFEGSVAKTYQIVLPDSGNTTIQFDALVTDLPLDIPLDDKITANVTLKLTGKPTLTS